MRVDRPARGHPPCVVDDGDDNERGGGTVFVTVGAGGGAPREVHPDDSEAPYIAAWSGTNAEPSWGNLRVLVSSSVLVAEFVPAVGAFSDRFGITGHD